MASGLDELTVSGNDEPSSLRQGASLHLHRWGQVRGLREGGFQHPPCRHERGGLWAGGQPYTGRTALQPYTGRMARLTWGVGGAGDGLAQRGWSYTERMQLKGPEICKRWFYCSKMKLCMVITTLMGFPGGSDGKESACNAGDPGSIPGSEDPLEKGMAAHSSILDWEIPWTEERGGLQSTGFQRVRHD